MQPAKTIIILAFLATVTSCKKSWLEEKPDISIVIPSSLQDLQAILDYEIIMNSNSPALGEMGADNYYLDSVVLVNSPTIDRNSYLWVSDVFEGEPVLDWDNCYKQVNYANIVLEGVEKISATPVNKSERDIIRGSALFFRTFAFYNLAQIFAPPYRKASAGVDLGIPLRLSSDINSKVGRSTVEEMYSRMLADLTEAAALLPSDYTIHKYFRPTKQAAYALLSRIHLEMQNYSAALKVSSDCLEISDKLLDYNQLDTSNVNPIQFPNPEVLFYTYSALYSGLVFDALIDSALYKSYHFDDLRRPSFYYEDGDHHKFKGSYSGWIVLFAGLSVDEVYFTRAECYARTNDLNSAMADLNKIMQSRWRNTVQYPVIAAADQNEALQKILEERRKELVFRGIRWSDLRRLNQEPDLSTTIARKINGQMLSLLPNDKKYVYPIPDNEIRYSGISQNPR